MPETTDIKKKKRGFEHYLLALFIFSIPIMINYPDNPILPEPVGGKVQLSEIVFIFLFALWLVGIIRGRYRISYNILTFPLLIYFLSALLAWIFTPERLTSTVELVGQIYLLSIFFVVTSIIQNKEDIDFYVNVVIFSLLFVVIVGIIQVIFVAFFGWSSPYADAGKGFPYFDRFIRVKSTFLPTTKMFSEYIVLYVGLLVTKYWTVNERRIKHLLGIGIGLTLFVFVFTFSRSIVGILFVLLILSFAQPLSHIHGIKIIRYTLTILVIAVLIGITIISSYYILSLEVRNETGLPPPEKRNVYMHFFPDKGVDSFVVNIRYIPDHYLWLKKVAMEAFKENPITGAGLESFGKELKSLRAKGIIPPTIGDYKMAQSTPFTILSERGIFGVVSLFFLWYIFLRNIIIFSKNVRGSEHSILLYGLMAGGVGILVDSLNVDIMNFRFLWIYISLGTALIVSTSKRMKEGIESE